MTVERITSRKNPLLQQVKKLLSSRKDREEAGLYAADGTKLLPLMLSINKDTTEGSVRELLGRI